MRVLTLQDMRDILAGSTILGCGGGGELDEGLALIERAGNEGGDFKLLDLNELSDSARVVCPYSVGALKVDRQDERYAGFSVVDEHPILTAVRILEEHLDEPFAAVVTGEIGGLSVAEAFYPAALLGLPLVDADPVGRAVPGLQQSAFFVHAVPITPQAATSEFGDACLVMRVVNDDRAEALLRAMAVASRDQVWVADHPVSGAVAKEVLIPGTISLARHVGAAYREALKTGSDLGQAVAEAGGGRVVFRGVIAETRWRNQDGFTCGEFEVDGTGRWDGSRLRVWYRNENLLSWLDGEPFVTTPDLISVIDDEARLPLTNPDLRLGLPVCTVGLPAADVWRTARGLEILGPRVFGFDLDYRDVLSGARGRP